MLLFLRLRLVQMFRAPTGTYLLKDSRVLIDPHEQFDNLVWIQDLPTLGHAIVEYLVLLLTQALEFGQQEQTLQCTNEE